MWQRNSPADLTHFYTYGEVYEALEACDKLEMLLGRLKRQRILGEGDWAQSRQNLTDLRQQLEERLSA